MAKFFRMLFWRRAMQKHADWFDNNPPAQARFEENEEWLEELEDRTIILEDLAHPKCGIEGFDGYQPLVNRIIKLEKEIENLKQLKQNDT
jgi:hypothetical protein